MAHAISTLRSATVRNNVPARRSVLSDATNRANKAKMQTAIDMYLEKLLLSNDGKSAMKLK
jgi:hypothetical protein